MDLLDPYQHPRVTTPVYIRETHILSTCTNRTAEPYSVRQTQWHAQFVSVVQEITCFQFRSFLYVCFSLLSMMWWLVSHSGCL